MIVCGNWLVNPRPFAIGYKCSAVAEMGDRFATIDMGCSLQAQAYLRPCNKHTMVSYMQLTTAQKQRSLHNKLRHVPKSLGAAVPPSVGSWVAM